ncbi:hypothetical protein [Pseudoxanthomonas sp. JBR18]|nr:hypothetical protein [Pseudoxanthomonas sp. JBR18]WCE05911.1 hypothetical protein PJ250_08175 [Pseudoxanthomonas sp. JBR18]
MPLWPNRPAGAHRYKGAGADTPTPAPLLAECGSAWATDHRNQA